MLKLFPFLSIVFHIARGIAYVLQMAIHQLPARPFVEYPINSQVMRKLLFNITHSTCLLTKKLFLNLKLQMTVTS